MASTLGHSADHDRRANPASLSSGCRGPRSRLSSPAMADGCVLVAMPTHLVFMPAHVAARPAHLAGGPARVIAMSAHLRAQPVGDLGRELGHLDRVDPPRPRP